MNKSIVKIIPKGDFKEVSIESEDWHILFLNLVKKLQLIKYSIYSMPNIPDDIQAELNARGYCELILESDNWQHFLVPKHKPLKH